MFLRVFGSSWQPLVAHHYHHTPEQKDVRSRHVIILGFWSLEPVIFEVINDRKHPEGVYNV
jgi:hypothetical protein